ncbi:MAG: CHAT domain-containing protein [Lyngbya sp. HA4199-MV5]|nr:CHAT domain-containing protein [Lyngbya sp. HA4199-MV5]
MKDQSLKILILTANPKGTDPLSLGVEVRKIEEALERATSRDRFKVFAKSAVRTIDLRRALLDIRPRIVHFSGHGAATQGLVLENDAGKIQLVSTEALARLFGAFEFGEIECVLLNACYSEVQAAAIHQYVDCVIGMHQPIGDKAAIQFAEGFYDALGAGSTYEEAYKLGCSAIDLEGISEYLTPVLKIRKRANSSLSNNSNHSQQPHSLPSAPIGADLSMKPSKTQSIGNISTVGSNNAFSIIQSDGNVNVSQNTSQASVDTTDLQAVLEALARLRQDVETTDALNPIQKSMVETPIKILEAELQKSPSNNTVIGQAVAALKQGLEGVAVLAEPVAKVAALVAKAWVI